MSSSDPDDKRCRDRTPVIWPLLLNQLGQLGPQAIGSQGDRLDYGGVRTNSGQGHAPAHRIGGFGVIGERTAQPMAKRSPSRADALRRLWSQGIGLSWPLGTICGLQLFKVRKLSRHEPADDTIPVIKE